MTCFVPLWKHVDLFYHFLLGVDFLCLNAEIYIRIVSLLRNMLTYCITTWKFMGVLCVTLWEFADLLCHYLEIYWFVLSICKTCWHIFVTIWHILICCATTQKYVDVKCHYLKTRRLVFKHINWECKQTRVVGIKLSVSKYT